MKTFRNWTATAMSLTSFLKPGDEVDQEMADYFINAVPPKTMTTDLIQLGEPHDHFRDQDRKYRPVFATHVEAAGRKMVLCRDMFFRPVRAGPSPSFRNAGIRSAGFRIQILSESMQSQAPIFAGPVRILVWAGFRRQAGRPAESWNRRSYL